MIAALPTVPVPTMAVPNLRRAVKARVHRVLKTAIAAQITYVTVNWQSACGLSLALTLLRGQRAPAQQRLRAEVALIGALWTSTAAEDGPLL